MEAFYHFHLISPNYFIFVAIILLSAGWRVLNTVWLKPKKLEKCLRKQGFSGNSYRLVIGDLKDMSNTIKESSSKPIKLSDDTSYRLVPFIQNTIHKYGKKSFTWLGPTPALTVLDPELVKEILTRNEQFHKVSGGSLTKLFVRSFEEDQWANHRKIINPAFHFDKLKHMIPAFHLSCEEMLSKWEKITSTNTQTEVDVWPFLQTMTADVISRSAFGSNFEQGNNIFELQKEQLHHVLESSWSNFVPGWRLLPIKRNKRMKEIAIQVAASIRSIIDKRLEAMEAGENRNDDLLGMLLDSNSKEVQENGSNKFGLSIQDIIEDCKLFYFAGQETTAVLLLWTMVLLSEHQDWQTRAREEVLHEFGHAKPGFNDLNHLKIVTMILLEVLRLYPPLAVLYRRTPKETNLGNLHLPEGVTLHMPIILLHQDTNIWGMDAKEFNPMRFNEGVAKATGGKFTFLPFGLGPRVCIGQNFAMLEAKLALAMILQRFSFELSPSYAHCPSLKITIHPQFGAHLILHKL